MRTLLTIKFSCYLLALIEQVLQLLWVFLDAVWHLSRQQQQHHTTPFVQPRRTSLVMIHALIGSS